MGRPSFNTDSFATIVIAALLYYLSYLSTYQLSSLFEFSHATSWVYLPSGVRLLLVLVLMESGAWAIMLGTLGIEYLQQPLVQRGHRRHRRRLHLPELTTRAALVSPAA
jgi:glucose-6-phosphate-specific signal transduction histidine kinase